MICDICPRKCNIDRSSNMGFCQSPEVFRVSRASLHHWEEPCISGKAGSGAVFFSGCNLKCVFCQNFEITHNNKGVEVSDKALIEIFENLIDKGACNINLINPTHYAVRLAEVLKKWHSPVPIVYNSSGYEDTDTLKRLEGLIDIYLPDYKYIRNDKSQRYSKAKDYPEVARLALMEMRRQQPIDRFDENGIMKSGMIIRHLVLPANTNSSIEVLDFLKKEYGNSYISIMAQYVPCGNLDDYSEINRKLSKREYDKVISYAISLGLENIFVQELSSADKKFIPDFDFEGIIDFI